MGVNTWSDHAKSISSAPCCNAQHWRGIIFPVLISHIVVLAQSPILQRERERREVKRICLESNFSLWIPGNILFVHSDEELSLILIMAFSRDVQKAQKLSLQYLLAVGLCKN